MGCEKYNFIFPKRRVMSCNLYFINVAAMVSFKASGHIVGARSFAMVTPISPGG